MGSNKANKVDQDGNKYRCIVCGDKFKKLGALRSHQYQTGHKGKPHECALKHLGAGDKLNADNKASKLFENVKLDENRKSWIANFLATADGAAAGALLQYIDASYRGRTWPATRAEFDASVTAVLEPLTERASPALHCWFDERFGGTVSAKTTKAALHLFVSGPKSLSGLNCLRVVKNDLSWHGETVRYVLAQLDAPGPREASPEITSTAPTEMVTRASLIATSEELRAAGPILTALGGDADFAVVCVVGDAGELSVVAVGTTEAVLVLDCLSLEPSETLSELLGTSTEGVRYFHDVHAAAAALAQEPYNLSLSDVVDTQLAMEALGHGVDSCFADMLKRAGVPVPQPSRVRRRASSGQRPLSRDVVKPLAAEVVALYRASSSLDELGDDGFDCVCEASEARAASAAAFNGARRISFDASNGYALASCELLAALRPYQAATEPLRVSVEAAPLLDLLPADLRAPLEDRTAELRDVILDYGRKPCAWIGDERTFLADREVTRDDLDAMVTALGSFGSDNRAGLERQLHRISAIRNREDRVIGLTLRVGRHVEGNAAMISDLLFADATQSILFLGEPGSGKTTIVRETARILADRANVVIVDTSNEIAGDGDVPHPCVGLARRMMVDGLAAQADVMIECVQNHTPEIMVIDEIGRGSEVEAARTCKNRGVRLVASAHGDLRKLVKNDKLRGLVGGVEQQMLGDAAAREEQKRHGDAVMSKVKATRAGPPIFDLIVELRRGALHEWRIVFDVAGAVDAILDRQAYACQRRTRDPATGAVFLAADHLA